MPPRKKATQAQRSNETEASPDPLQITANGASATTTDSPASAQRSARSRKSPGSIDKASSSRNGEVQTSTPTPSKATARKRALPAAAADDAHSGKDQEPKTSKRARVDTVVASDSTNEESALDKWNRLTNGGREPLVPQSNASPAKKPSRGPPRKTPAVESSPKKSDIKVPLKTTTPKRKPVGKADKESGRKATVTTPTSVRARKSSVVPIRHSSNPLDEEQHVQAGQVEPTDPAILPEIEAAEHLGNAATTAAFDLTSEQSRELFLRNERWQRDKDARNFNFEGDVNEVRRLRSGRAVAVSEMEESVVDDTEENDVAEEEEDEEGEDDDPMLDVEEQQRRREMKGKGKESDVAALIEPDNDYLSQLTYDTSMPIEAHKSTLIQPTNNPAGWDDVSQHHEHARHSPSLSPFAKRVLKTVIGNLACSSAAHTASLPSGPGPEEEKNEALMQLVNLLTGTVERGEGNSCLVLGAKGSGKTRTVNHAISLVRDNLTQHFTNGHTNGSSSTPATKEDRRPIVVRLDGLAQTNDMLAIREMGRQIAVGEGERANDGDLEEDDETEDAVQAAENTAPTTLPAHLLAHLTAPSSRAIVIVIENFDLFTNHARQALLYCLLDVVQGVRTGPVAATGRGVAVIGVTSRMDTTLLLEKRVKSRFSQRIYRVVSPLSGNDWKRIVRLALLPLTSDKTSLSNDDALWLSRWESQVDISPVQQFALAAAEGKLEPSTVVTSIREQIHSTGWGKKLEKLQGLSHPSLVILIIAKHFAYAGKEEFNLAMVEHEYQRFARTQLAGSGRARWSTGILEVAWNHLLSTGLIFPATRFRASTNPYMQRFLMVRALLSRNEVIAYFKGDGGKVLGTELTGWGRTAGGHA
ncbi:hypothetical protein QFC21_002428 [Naganishia friedmannii]|uniref:Uncharacterized protein n=1 Tax=Naganishia friedmannii TaxID=89922 RepID=A0ACC2VYM6_9TREE|nr:hypothetical protein QFC21_002428 [Naganishia friedmannii]